MTGPRRPVTIFLPSVLLLILLPVFCTCAGCMTGENKAELTPAETHAPVPYPPGSFAGNWTDREMGGNRLDLYPNHNFELVQVSGKTGDRSSLRGEWTAVNNTVCALHAFLPSPGGVGMGYYSATGILDPQAGTLKICAYQSSEECRSGMVMIRE